MKKKIILYTLGIGFIIVSVFASISLGADPHYEGSITQEFNATQSQIWDILNDTKRHSLRRHEVKKVDILGVNAAGYPMWREHTGLAGTITLQVTELEPKKSMTVEMTESGFGMTGLWKFNLETTETGTAVTIHENSDTKGFIMRGILSIVGRDGNLKLQLKAIEKALKESNDGE